MHRSTLTGSPVRLELPARFDFTSCRAFVDVLSKTREQDVEIVVGPLEFLGALGAELLLRAQAEWREAGREFKLIDPSSKLLEALKELGISEAEFTMETRT